MIKIKRYLSAVSISNKIVWSIIIFAGTTYFLSSSIFLVMNKAQHESALFNQISTLSDFINDDAAPFIISSNQAKLTHLLSRLSNNPNIISAEIYNLKTRKRTRYIREGDNSYIKHHKIKIRLRDLNDKGYVSFFKGNLFYLSKPIYYDYDVVGVFTIKSDISNAKSTFDYQTEASVLMIIILFLIGLPTANMIRRFLMKPIYELLNFMNDIGETRDYSDRLKRTEDDEIGLLVDGFHSMLDKIERRNHSIEEKAEELEKALGELKDTQGQLVQNSKLASVGQLAAGVAHEINNPIAFVNSNTKTLKKYVESLKELIEQYQKLQGAIDDDSNKELLELKESIETLEKKSNIDFILEDFDELVADSIEGLDRVTTIVADLKSFSRVDESEIQEIDINEMIDSTIKIVWNDLKYKCEMHKDYGELPPLRCFAGQLSQVVMNLIVNASQAMEDKGNIWIKTYVEEPNLMIQIKDDGAGIPEENLEKLFDPFFTTKPVGEGTGLGLSISYGVLQKHDGDILVDSTVGEGTTFTLQLPLKGVPEDADEEVGKKPKEDKEGP